MKQAAPNPIVNPAGKLPVGVSNFTELIQGGYTFVDKTLFIKEVLDAGDKVILVTRPRRFGKTVNLNTLRCFLHWPPDHQPDLFEGLAISQVDERYLQERGKRPVLFLTLKDIKAQNWHDAWIALRGLLADLAESCSRDAPADALTQGQQKILHRVIQGEAEPAESQATLAILTKLLTHKHNGFTPWVLIDEYDTPMHAAYQYDYYSHMRGMMRGLLGQCLKDNEDPQQPRAFLHKAVLTGIVRVTKEDIFSDLNNLGTFGVLDDRFASCFGFTGQEVKQLLAQRGLAERFDLVRKTYDGYRFGHDSPVSVYNPWSVMRYVSQPTQDAPLYWVNTSDNHLVHKLLARADAKVKQSLHELLNPDNNNTTTQPVCEYVPLRHVENNAKNLWGLLLASGYVTAASHDRKYGSPDRTVQLRIPNEEVLSLYNGLLDRWLQGANGIGGGDLLDALVAGQVEEFAGRFETFVLESMSYFDKGNHEPERFYHGFVLGMMQHLRDRYIVDSQRESGLGRYDLALEPKDKTKLGFVMEFKSCVRQTDSLWDTAHQALQQIQDKQYHVNLMQRGVKTIIALGLAFKGKQVAVVHQQLSDNNAKISP